MPFLGVVQKVFIVLRKRSLGGHRNAGRRPSVSLSVCPSVRPTCECDILRTISPIDFKFEI